MTIQEKIDANLAKKQEERKTRKRSGKWSPSSFGRCFRYQFWNRKNEPQTNPPDARSLRIFASGHLFHDFVQNIISEDFPQMEIEKPVETEDVFGYADIVTEDEVIDIKSQHSRAFWYMTKNDFNISDQKKENVLQIMAYAVILNKKYVRLVYVSKDDLCINEYRLLVTKEWAEEIGKELFILNDYWELDELPDAEPRSYGGMEKKDKKTGICKECGYCPYLDKCKQTGGLTWENLKTTQTETAGT